MLIKESIHKNPLIADGNKLSTFINPQLMIINILLFISF
jgi:hypothetical protein